MTDPGELSVDSKYTTRLDRHGGKERKQQTYAWTPALTLPRSSTYRKVESEDSFTGIRKGQLKTLQVTVYTCAKIRKHSFFLKMERRSVSRSTIHGHGVSLYRAYQHVSGRIPGKETQTPRPHVRYAPSLQFIFSRVVYAHRS